MNLTVLLKYGGLVVCGAPLLGFLVLGVWGLLGAKVSERVTVRITSTALSISFLAGVLLVILASFVNDFPAVSLIEVPLLTLHHSRDHQHHSVQFALQIDALSLPFTIVTALLTGVVGYFSSRYLHRDPGHYRFFLLLLLFALGMHVVTMGASFEVIFMGWEIIGLTSALLISFYQSRKAVIENSLRAFLFYRFSDSTLLIAATLFSSAAHGLSFAELRGQPVTLTGVSFFAVPLLVLVAAMVKSAQYPFTSWLPRAMEGPTPSSAIFYGGLSIHAGLFLLLRLVSVTTASFWFSALIVAVGAVTVLLASLFARVQSDIKSSLALSAVVQVGLMFVEVGFGFTTLAIYHFVGHSIFRTYQILGAASIVHEGRKAHVHDYSAPPLVDLGLPPTLFDKLYCFAFDGALGITRGGPTRVVRAIENLSRSLGVVEDRVAELALKLLPFLGRSRRKGTDKLGKRQGTNPSLITSKIVNG